MTYPTDIGGAPTLREYDPEPPDPSVGVSGSLGGVECDCGFRLEHEPPADSDEWTRREREVMQARAQELAYWRARVTMETRG